MIYQENGGDDECCVMCGDYSDFICPCECIDEWIEYGGVLGLSRGRCRDRGSFYLMSMKET